MAKLDKLKEEIGWMKIIFGILIAADISLLAWVAQNYNETDTLLRYICIFGIVVITGIIFLINKAAYRRIDELEDL